MADVKRFSEVSSVMAPANGAFAITVSDSTNETQPFRSLYIGTAGNIVLRTLDDQTVTFANITTAFILPVQGKRVNSTNTTASGLIGLY